MSGIEKKDYERRTSEEKKNPTNSSQSFNTSIGERRNGRTINSLPYTQETEDRENRNANRR